MWIVRSWKVEPRNPDSLETEPDGPFINHDFMEKVDTGTFGPFDTDERAEQWVHGAQSSWPNTRFEIEELTPPLVFD